MQAKYILFSVVTDDNLCCIGGFKKSTIKVNKNALLEYERLKENDLFSMLKRRIISDDTITILVHNVTSLSKHVNDIVSDSKIMHNDIIELTETQISLSGSTCRIKPSKPPISSTLILIKVKINF